MEITLIIFGLILAILGIVGCIVPVMPATGISYLSLIALSLARHWEPFTAGFLILWALLGLVTGVLDYFVPLASAKKSGASKAGVRGSLIGTLVGIFFFPPWGMMFGALIGAVVGELAAGQGQATAVHAGWGIFLGTVLSLGIKLAYASAILFVYLREIL